MSSAPLYLIVNPEVPAKTLKELIDLAKAKPGTLNFSSAGLASTTFIAGALFRKAAGINIVHVPFKSAPDAVTAVVRGDAHMYFAPVNLSKEMAEAGKVRALASVTAQRIPQMPNVPTFGRPGSTTSTILVRPDGARGRAASIIDKINGDMVQIIKSPRGPGEARGAVRHRRDRYAAAIRQDHQGRNRQPDRGVQGRHQLAAGAPQRRRGREAQAGGSA